MRYQWTVFLAVCCWGIFSFAQTADELVAKNIQARGGMEKVKAVKTKRMTGWMRTTGRRSRTAAVGQENARPNLLRETITMQGLTQVDAYDGTTGWQIQPFRGRRDPQLMGEDNLRDLLLDADFDGPLVDYQEKGSAVEYLGHDLVDGDDALRLKITLKNGDVIYDFLDPDTFMEIRQEIQQFIRGSVRERVVSLGSYKPVDGVMFPFWVAQGPRGNPEAVVYTWRRIEVNVPIDPADFLLPQSLRSEEKKSGMVGVK
jgi:hypothetical protein